MASTHSRSDNITIRWRLPEGMRQEMKAPVGKIVDDDGLKAALEGSKVVAAVGDIVTLTMARMGIEPKIVVVDFKTKRLDREELAAELRTVGKTVFEVVNPPGTLTQQLWDAVAEAYAVPGTVRIEVDGEEDLASLACIALAPEGTAVVYGVPDVGMMVILAEEAKLITQDALKRMEA